MKESSSGVKLRHWLKANPQYSCAIETKTTTSSLSFSEVKQAQLDWALAIRSDKGVLMRIEAIVEGMPDYVYLRNTPSWIVIHFVKQGFVFISPDRFIAERDSSKRRSLTYDRAKQISSIDFK